MNTVNKLIANLGFFRLKENKQDELAAQLQELLNHKVDQNNSMTSLSKDLVPSSPVFQIVNKTVDNISCNLFYVKNTNLFKMDDELAFTIPFDKLDIYEYFDELEIYSSKEDDFKPYYELVIRDLLNNDNFENIDFTNLETTIKISYVKSIASALQLIKDNPLFEEKLNKLSIQLLTNLR